MADSISDEDKALFLAHMRSVKPLATKKHLHHDHGPKPTVPLIKSFPLQIQTKSFFLSDSIVDTVSYNTILSFHIAEFSSKRFKELKKGTIPWEKKLDLHGLHIEQARESLIAFIKNHYAAHNRCLLIIHGKGGHHGEPPIIKNLVNRWLPQFTEISAFHSATSRDGGTGAVYVFLKKSKIS